MPHQQEYYTVNMFNFTCNGYRSSPLDSSASGASISGQFWAISHYNLTRPYEIRTGSVVESFDPSGEGIVKKKVIIVNFRLTKRQAFTIQ